jgi:hypothetical protein
MKLISPRPLTAEEASVLRAALSLAPASVRGLPSIEGLTVHGVCECGCRTIYFEPVESGDTQVVDGCGTTANGRMVEVVVWAKGDHVTALDIVDYESTGLLPTHESVRSWDQASR